MAGTIISSPGDNATEPMPGNRFFLERYGRMGQDLSGDERTRSALRVNALKTDAEALVERPGRLGATL
jgi:hypothetical protein